MSSMKNKRKESWIVGDYKINVLPEDKFQQTVKDQLQLQHMIETLPLPTDPNVDLVKKIHNQLPITNWAWKITKQREKELKKQKSRIARQSFNHSMKPKQSDNGPSL